MKEEDIRKYAGLMKELGLTGLEITEDNVVVRLERQNAADRLVKLPAEPAEKPAPEADYISVRSPMVGVFYAAPAENADPYVSIGSRVEAGSPLCVIEAMKLMTEINAEEAGTVVQICATNGQVVEYGTELFRIKR